MYDNGSSSYTIIWYLFVSLAKNSMEQLKWDPGFLWLRISLKYFTTPYCVLVLMVHSFTIQTNILCRDASPSRFDQTSRHTGAIDGFFYPRKFEWRTGHSTHSTHNDMRNIVDCRLSVVGTPYSFFANQCQHCRYYVYGVHVIWLKGAWKIATALVRHPISSKNC